MSLPEELQAILEQLNYDEKQELLEWLNSALNGGMHQVNSDQTTNFQVVVQGGIAYVGNSYVDKDELEQALRSVLEDWVDPPIPLDDNQLLLDENYSNLYSDFQGHEIGHSRGLSNLGYAPVLIGCFLIVGLGFFVSGLGRQNATVTTSNPNGVNVRDDVGKVKETVAHGTRVRLTKKRDGNYCKTDIGWIYCSYLVKTQDQKHDKPNINAPSRTGTSSKTATIQPESDKNAANVRIQPNSGKIVGQISRGQKVQLIRCVTDACEVTYNSIKGWVYKPYLR